MKTAKLTDVKNNLSRYVDQVRKGERVRILVRGVPVADLVPITGWHGEKAAQDGRIADLERRGVIRRGGPMPQEILKPGPMAEGKPLSSYIIDEREIGR